MHWRRKLQPTPVFLPGESQGQGSLVGCRLWGRTESDMTEVTWQQQQKDLPIEGASTPSFRSLLQNHFLFLKNNSIYLFVFGCARSSLLHRLVSTCVEGGLLSSCSAWASHCSGLSCWAWTLGHRVSVVEAHGLFSCNPWAPEDKFNSCGTWA